MDKAAEGLRATAAGLEEAAKQIQGIQDPTSPDIKSQLDSIEETLKLIPVDLAQRLQTIDKLFELIPNDLDKQLARLEASFSKLPQETANQVARLYVDSLIPFQSV